MSPNTMDDLGKLILRVTIGVLILMHGISKLLNGIGSIENMIVAQGLPAFFAWGVYIGEVVAPLLLIAGFYARLGALLVVVNMIVAIVLAHSTHIFQLGGTGGWRLELQGLFLFGSLAVALLGAGRFSVAGKNGRWN
jgi:putative oxidoreductase